MATSKKPRKKPNIKKRASDRVCKNTLVVSAFGLGESGTVWIKNNRPVRTGKGDPMEYHLTFEVPRPWSLFCGVMCRDKEGKVTCDGEYLTLSRQIAMNDSEMDEFVDGTLTRLVAENNHDCLLTPFMIASPEEVELSDDSAYKLLNWLRVEENCRTPYELMQMRDEGYKELRQVGFADCLPAQTIKILRDNGVNDFADMRDVGLSQIEKFKGIGKARLQQLQDGYHELLNKPENLERLAKVCAFEEAFYNFKFGTGRFLPDNEGMDNAKTI